MNLVKDLKISNNSVETCVMLKKQKKVWRRSSMNFNFHFKRNISASSEITFTSSTL